MADAGTTRSTAADATAWADARQMFNRRAAGRLRAVAGRVHQLAALRGGARLAVVAVGVAFADLLLDWWLRLDGPPRIAILAVVGAAMLVLAARWVLRPLTRSISTADAAVLLERRFPELRDRLVSAVQFAAQPAMDDRNDDGPSPIMMQRVLHSAMDELRRLPVGRLFATTDVSRFTIVGVAAIIAFGGAWLLAPQTVGLWAQRNLLLSNTPWPKSTHLMVEGLRDGVLPHPRGDDLNIRVGVREGSTVPRIVDIDYRFDSGESGDAAMTRLGERVFVADFPRVHQALRFRIRGGDDRTGWIPVELIERPRVLASRIAVTPPTYTHQPTRTLRDNATLAEVLPGGIVEATIQTNEPIETADLLFEGSPAGAVERIDDTTWRGRIAPSGSGNIHFDLLATNGLRNRHPTPFTIRLQEDHKPHVSLRWPGVGDMVTPAAVLPLEVELTDEFGLATAALNIAIEPGEDRNQTQPLALFEPGTPRHQESFELPMESLAVSPGDRVSLVATASDFDDVRGPNVGESLSATFRIVTEAELLAELTRREQEYRREIEQLLKTEERIRADLLGWAAGADERDADATTQLLSRLARQQKNAAVRAGGLQRQIVQLVAEAAINRVSENASRDRLTGLVATPLDELARRKMPDVVDMLDTLRTAADPANAGAIDAQLDEIIKSLRLILSQMIKWEGYQEAVTLLREIVELQGEVSEETQAALDRQVQELFGTDE